MQDARVLPQARGPYGWAVMGRKAGELHVRIGLKLRTHERAFRAGGYAMGVYVFCLMQARAEERDQNGYFSSRVVAHGFYGDPPRKVRDALAKLVDSELLSVVDADTMCVRNYADFNETKAEIEDRRARDRARKTPAPASEFRVESNRIPGGAADSDSVSVSDLGRERVQGEGAATSAPGAIPPDLPITDDLVAACAMAGAPKPTRDDVQLMLAEQRKTRRVPVDQAAAVVAWMLRQKRFDRDRQERTQARDGPVFSTAPTTKTTLREVAKRDADMGERVPIPGDFAAKLFAPKKMAGDGK